jgi:hypothetical protein
MEKIKIHNEKEISTTVLLSQAFRLKRAGTWVLFKPTEFKPTEFKVRGFYILDGKPHITNCNPSNLMSEKQYQNLEFLTEKR